MRLFLLVALVAAPALAQSRPLQARNFHFDDYRTVLRVDMTALRATGVIDELSRSALLLDDLLEKEIGFELEALDRMTMTRGAYAAEDGAQAFGEVVVLEGNAELGDAVERRGRHDPRPVGAHTLYVRSYYREAFVAATPKLHVYGPLELVQDVLDGEPRSGLPSADAMAFSAGKKGCLAYFLVDLERDVRWRQKFQKWVGEVVQGAEWPEGDAPKMVGGRVLATGEEDDPHLTFELVLRHGTVGAGLAASEQAVDAAVKMLLELPQARLFRPILKGGARERSGTDVVWRVDLGRARNADGLFVTALPFLLLDVTLRRAQAAAVEALNQPLGPGNPGAGGGK